MTKIEWTRGDDGAMGKTWNPVRGCSVVSPGCTHCYAMKQAARFPAYRGLTKPSKGGPVWTGEVRLVPEKLGEPLRWRKPRRVFVNSMSDLFHEGVPDEFIAEVFGVMALADRHTFQILTKRPERMRRWIEEHTCANNPRFWPLPNVWLGVSCEDQVRADERIPLLLDTPAAVRFVSYEPALGPLQLDPSWIGGYPSSDEWARTGPKEPRLSWLIVGGESGPSARPCDVSWVRSIVAQCRAAGVACFVKQLGARPYETFPPGYKDAQLSREGWTLVEYADGSQPPRWSRFPRYSDRKGGDPAEWPEDLRVREWPA
jgi:protein gp37